MRIGYDRLQTPREVAKDKAAFFLSDEVDKIIIELYKPTEVFPERSKLTHLLDTMEAGDTLIVRRLESVSETVSVWQQLLKTLRDYQVELEVSVAPSLTLINWQELLTWWPSEKLISRTRSQIISVTKEDEKEAKRIRPLARSYDDRELYWRAFKKMQQGDSLRKTAKRLDISQGTVLRVKRDVRKLKQTVWLVGTFFVTMASLKIAQSYSDNWLIQVIICGIATISIIYLSYSDIKESE